MVALTPPSFEHLGIPVATDDGSLTMQHPEHGECYHARQGAMAETQALYIESSGLKEHLQDKTLATLHVLDVGLGLGYNAIATLLAWSQAPSPSDLSMLSLEIDPDLVAAIASGEAPWQSNWSPELLDFAKSLQPSSTLLNTAETYLAEIKHRNGLVSATWRVLIGDACKLELSTGNPTQGWNYIWQDPFSPEKNPTMWGEAWFRKLHPHCAVGCQLMSYSVARSVRDALQVSGFVAERFDAPCGHKRHWLRAQPQR